MRQKVLPMAFAAALAGCMSGPANQAPANPEPAPAPAHTAPERLPATPAEQQQAQKIALHVAELLEIGNESEALGEITRALSLDQNNKLALNFKRQINVDPVAELGTESFPYTVRPGETLSRISGRYMGDIYAFYLLARYNNVRVPKQVAFGQTIRVPGKMPPPEIVRPPKPEPAPPVAVPTVASPQPAAAPVPLPIQESQTPADKAYRAGLAAQKSGNKELAYQQFREASQLSPSNADARVKLEQSRKDLSAQYERNARSAFAKQDLNGAIQNWSSVLELDPGNDTARLEKQKAVKLKSTIDNLK